MPEEIEDKLKKEVKNKKWSDERKGAYIYDTLRKKSGWVTKKKVFKT